MQPKGGAAQPQPSQAPQRGDVAEGVVAWFGRSSCMMLGIVAYILTATIDAAAGLGTDFTAVCFVYIFWGACSSR